MSDYYVVVSENDKPSKFDGKVDPNGAIVFEQYLKDATKEQCQEFIDQVASKYGKCRIAKLEFIEEQK